MNLRKILRFVFIFVFFGLVLTGGGATFFNNTDLGQTVGWEINKGLNAPTPIEVRGAEIYQNGQRVQPIFVNSYNVLSTAATACGPIVGSQELLDGFARFREIGISGVRFWATPYFTEIGYNLDRMNEIVDFAQLTGQLLIPVLENQWGDCAHQAKDDRWYRAQSLDPETLYRRYAQQIIPLYQDRVMIFELINEPEAEHELLSDFSDYFGERFPNKVMIGLMGSGQRGSSSLEWIRVQDPFPLTSVHMYGTPELTLGDEYNGLGVRLDQAEYMQKPLIMGELGLLCTIPDRVQKLGEYIKAFFAAGGDAVGLWSAPLEYDKPVVCTEGSYDLSFEEIEQIVQIARS